MPTPLSNLRKDLHYALRQLRNTPTFTLTAILTLALGLGATTAMLAVIDSVLLRPIALPHSERVVSLERTLHGQRQGFDLGPKDFDPFHTATQSFSTLAGFGTLPAPVTTSAGTRVDGVVTSTSQFFQVVGVPAELGRVLSAQDQGAPVAVVTDDFWRTRLATNPHVLGTTLKLDNRLLRIVGVMPPGFAFPQTGTAPFVYVLVTRDAKGQDAHGFTSVQLVGRLKPGVSLTTASAEVDTVFRHAAHDKDYGHVTLRPFRQVITGSIQPALYALLGACCLLLLIACANFANLQTARAVTRTAEMNVRAALGASRGRLLQQILTESITISLLGALLGLLFATTALHLLRTGYGQQFARFNELALHPSVFAACALLATVAGALAALAPAYNTLRHAGGLPASQAMRVTRRSRLSGILVALQVALTCVLLTGAGLFLRTFRALQQAPLGFDPHHVTQLTLMPIDPQTDGRALVATYQRMLDRLGSLPGVQAAATQSSFPFARFTLSFDSAFKIPGRPPHKDDHTGISLVSAGYTQTMGVPVLQGRALLPSDGPGAPLVCLVNQSFVRRSLQGHQPLGTSIEFTSDTKDGTDDRFLKSPVAIVGIVPDALDGRSLADQPGPMFYLDYRQFPPTNEGASFLFGLAPQFAVRSTLSQATLDREIRAVLKDTAPNFAEMQLDPMQASIAATLTNQRLALGLATGFGAVALLLAGVGIYGVLAYAVAQRTREIGIRMALGSTRAGAMRLILGQAASTIAAGLAIGLLCTWPAGRAVRTFLYGVTPLDPASSILAATLLIAVCCAAVAIPTYRAAQVDPIEALRRD